MSPLNPRSVSPWWVASPLDPEALKALDVLVLDLDPAVDQAADEHVHEDDDEEVVEQPVDDDDVGA